VSEVPSLTPVKRVAIPFDNGHWRFSSQMGKPEFIGFIYIIHDLYMRKMYLGKKLYRGMGKSNNGVESNWKRYISSSKLLGEHVDARPKDEFDFICVEEYKTKSGLSYAETWSLCFVEAPTKAEWYNKRIEAISWNVKEKITDRHKTLLLDF
jgi:hypothetical protein